MTDKKWKVSSEGIIRDKKIRSTQIVFKYAKQCSSMCKYFSSSPLGSTKGTGGGLGWDGSEGR